MPSLHRVYHEPTAPHGNETILYKFETGQTAVEMRVEFSADATPSIMYMTCRKGH